MQTIKRIIEAAQDFITEIQVEHMRKQVLNRKLENLTDPTLLDRMIQGEK